MIIFMYGEDDFLAKRKIKELKDKFLREIDKTGNSLSFLDGSSVAIGDVARIAGSASLLAEKRMLVIENVFSNKSKDFVVDLLKYFKADKDSKNIIIVHETRVKTEIKKGSVKYIKINTSSQDRPLLKKEQELFDFLAQQKFSYKEFKKLDNLNLTNFIKQEVQSRGADISLAGAHALGGLVSGDLWQIDNEIDKLINYKRGIVLREKKDNTGVQIEEDEVLQLVKGSFDENIFALTDAVSSRNKALANKLLEEQYSAGLTDSHLLTMIIRQVKILLQIRGALDAGMAGGQLATSLKLHPFVAQKGANQARNFNQATLKRLLECLVEIDYKMKTGQAPARTLLNLLLCRV